MCYGVHIENAWIPNDFACLYVLCRARILVWGIILNTKETLPDFFLFYKKIFCKLAGDLSLCTGHVLGWVVTKFNINKAKKEEMYLYIYYT